MRKLLLYILLTTLFNESFAQVYTIKTTPLISHLYTSKNNIPIISNISLLDIIPETVNKTKTHQKIIKTKSGLYLLIDGTGKVFKANNLQNNNIQFERIDSTVYFGNTFYSIDFALNDTIYSFGGYGFWHMNGQLRYFNNSKEWNIHKIKNYRNTINFIYKLKENERQLFYFETPIIDEEKELKTSEFNLIRFDFDTKTNTKIGKINSHINITSDFFIDLPNLNGSLIIADRKYLLINYDENKVYKLINKSIEDQFNFKSGTKIQNTFVENNRIYFSNYPDTTLRSIPISMKDFQLESYLIYDEETAVNYWLIALILVLIITISIISFLLIKKNKQRIKEFIYEQTDSIKFNEIEIKLIEELIEKSSNGSFFTSDDLNNFLGTKKKTMEIQKNIRNEALNRINHKYKINCKTDVPLIQRLRSNEDGRFINYIINYENSKNFRTYINQQKK